MKNYFKIIILLRSFLLIGGNSFSYAQETDTSCSVCGNTPQELSQINDFIIEILNKIQTVGTEQPYLGKYVSPQRFETGKFTPPKIGLVRKGLMEAEEALQSALAVQRIFMKNPLAGTTELINGSVILSKGKPFQRDRKKILTVEKAINKKKFELSVGGGRTDEIRENNLKIIENVIKKYKDNGLLNNSDTYITQYTQFNHLINILEKINTDTKKVLGVNQFEALKEVYNKDTYIRIKFNNEKINNIEKSYDCAIGFLNNKCNEELKSVKEEIKNISKTLGDGSKNARKEIKDANKRLADTFKKNKKKTKEEKDTESEMMQTLYGLKAYKDIIKRGEDIIQKAKESFKNMKNRRLLASKTGEDDQNKNTSSSTTTFNITTIVTKEKINMQQTLINTFNTTKQEAASTQSKILQNSINDITRRFGVLSELMNENKKLIEKDNSDGLINNLGGLCEAQCSNIGGKKCYY